MRNAEMKWTNHSKLSVYGVRLNGWPDGVPVQSPSTFSVAQNRLLLDLLHEGKLHFSRLDGVTIPEANFGEDGILSEGDENAIFEDSIDYTWGFGEARDTGSTVSVFSRGLYYHVLTLHCKPQEDLISSPHISTALLDATKNPSRIDDADGTIATKRRRIAE